MKDKSIEIEIKVKIENASSLINFLKKNAKYQGTKTQIDEYFVPKHRNFLKFRPTREWLRLRSVDNLSSINYKNWHYDKNGKTNYCDEFETQVSDIKQMNNIFEALDMKSVATVDKKRETWLYKDFEISIDKVKKLGTFVEIEYKGSKSADPKETTDKMIDLLKEAGCGKINRNYQGYPFLLLFPKEAKFE